MSMVNAYILVGGILFAIGLVGFLTRRNMILMFLATEIMFQGVILNLMGFSLRYMNLTGQAFALFLIVIAAVEAGVALGLVVLLYRR
ncbi:MAG: NADH-quinone oxidoreductase subunit NuoK, partial [Planctomycetes bacterium]|nr:NADH-quinone oxidoreductase subunit NuoK [Planctomycetota bacterium]